MDTKCVYPAAIKPMMFVVWDGAADYLDPSRDLDYCHNPSVAPDTMMNQVASNSSQHRQMAGCSGGNQDCLSNESAMKKNVVSCHQHVRFNKISDTFVYKT